VGVGELAWTDAHAHGLAHDRVGELEAVRGPGDVEGDQPIRGAGASSSVSSAIAAASARRAPSPSTATARTRAPAAGGAPDRRSRTASVTSAGAIRRTRRASSELAFSRRWAASPRSASRKNGLPPVASRHATAKSGTTFAPSRRSHNTAVASMLNGDGRSTMVSGPAMSRAKSIGFSPLRVDAKTTTQRPSRRGVR